MTLLFTLLGDDQLDRITKYGYVLGARYFKTQKIKFIKEIKEEFEHSNYMAILNSNCLPLISYIDSNINRYVENVFLKLEDNKLEAEHIYHSL